MLYGDGPKSLLFIVLSSHFLIGIQVFSGARAIFTCKQISPHGIFTYNFTCENLFGIEVTFHM
jgi:hypothetical protein